MTSNQNKLISIIVPVYNVEKYIACCLESILNQSYPHLEIIIVDDASTDASLAICKTYASQDTRIKIIQNKKNFGLSATRNIGLKFVKGNFVAFVDSDDWIEPESFEKYIHFASKADEKTILISGFKIIKHGKIFDKYYENYRIEDKHTALTELIKDNTFRNFMWNKLYPRTLLSSFHFDEGKTFEDIMAQYILFEKASQFIICPFIAYNYRIHKQSITNSCNLKNEFCLIMNLIDRFHILKDRHPYLLQPAIAQIFSAYINFIYFLYIKSTRHDKNIIQYRDTINTKCADLEAYITKYLPIHKKIIFLIGLKNKKSADIFIIVFKIVNTVRTLFLLSWRKRFRAREHDFTTDKTVLP